MDAIGETGLGDFNRSFMLTAVLVGSVSPIPEPGDKIWVPLSSPVAPPSVAIKSTFPLLLLKASPCWTNKGVACGSWFWHPVYLCS